MTQQCAPTAGKDSRHPAAAIGQLGMANRVHRRVEAVQAPRDHAMADGASAEAELGKLATSHDSMLASRQRRDDAVTWTRSCTYVAH